MPCSSSSFSVTPMAAAPMISPLLMRRRIPCPRGAGCCRIWPSSRNEGNFYGKQESHSASSESHMALSQEKQHVPQGVIGYTPRHARTLKYHLYFVFHICQSS